MQRWIGRFLEDVIWGRRLRDLGKAHERLLDAHRTLKSAYKADVARERQRAENALRRLQYRDELADRARHLEAEVERLRERNGENYKAYVRVQDELDRVTKSGRFAC